MYLTALTNNIIVSTHSRLKAAGASIPIMHLPVHCFNTQPPEGGWPSTAKHDGLMAVSTHSRLKAAGSASALSSISE